MMIHFLRLFSRHNRHLNRVQERSPAPGRADSAMRVLVAASRGSTVSLARDLPMSRQDANAAFALTSFLYGGNAAYIEDLYARYEADPNSVDAEWQAFFQSLKDDAARGQRERARPVLAARRTGRGRERDELIAALDGDWAEVEQGARRQGQGQGADQAASSFRPPRSQQATRDSIRALMLIRAYRARGHFHANLDPLGLEPPQDRGGARPALLRLQRSRSRPADLPRQRARARIRHASARSSPSCGAPIARRSASSSCTSPTRAQKGWIQERIEGPGQGDHASPARASARSSTSWSKPKASRNSAIVKFTGTKRFGLDGGESMIPALEQIIKRGGALGVQEIVHRHGRIAAASTCWRR